MPAKERLGGDRKRHPGRSGEEPAGCGEEHPVSAPVVRTADLATEHLQLVAKHEELRLRGASVAPDWQEKAAKGEIEKREQHR